MPTTRVTPASEQDTGKYIVVSTSKLQEAKEWCEANYCVCTESGIEALIQHAPTVGDSKIVTPGVLDCLAKCLKRECGAYLEEEAALMAFFRGAFPEAVNPDTAAVKLAESRAIAYV